MQPNDMLTIYYWDKKLDEIIHVLEADIITIKKTLIWCLKLKGFAFFIGRVPNDHHWVFLSNKSLSY